MGNSFPTDKCINTGTNAIIQFESKYSDTDDNCKQIKKIIDPGTLGFNGPEDPTCMIFDRINHKEKMKTYIVSYHVGGKVVRLYLEIIYWASLSGEPPIKFLRFCSHEPESVYAFVIDIANHNLLNHIPIYTMKGCNEKYFANEIKNQWGGFTKTDVDFRGGENDGNLVVVELKRKQGFTKPFEITVTHYYAVSSQNYEVGLSVMVDIKVLNNNLDVSWKGPSEHPSSALLEMFQQVSRTWTWKSTYCPHCASQTRIQQFQTETETDGDEERDQHQQIGRCSIDNRGVIIGDYSGSIIVDKLIIVIRRWFNK
jgi:hypothetical protein